MDRDEFLRNLDMPNDHPFAEALAPAVRLRVGSEPVVGGSKLGGIPDLPESVEWPRWDTREFFARELVAAEARFERNPDSPFPHLKNRVELCRSQLDAAPRALTFLAQLRTDDLAFSGLPFPTAGLLLFFYDMAEQPWGFDPGHKGSWHVEFVPAGIPLTPRPHPDDHNADFVLTSTAVDAQPTWTFPQAVESDGEIVEFWEDIELGQAWDEADPEPRHQVGGFPEQIQGDMARECALVSQGVYLGGGRPDLPDDEMRRLEASATEWRLVFQFASDDNVGVMWGDVGNVYFWMREQDIESGDWSNAWLQLQCS